MDSKMISTDQLIDYFDQAADDPDAHPDADDIAADLRLYKNAYESGGTAPITLKRHWVELYDRISQFDLNLLLLEAGGFDEEELSCGCGYYPNHPLFPELEISE